MTNSEMPNPFRKLVAGTDIKVPTLNGLYKIPVNFDNAATTPPFAAVLNEINKFAPWYSSVHRGNGYKSMLSTNIFEKGKSIIKEFVKADRDEDVVIYTKNTTDSINILSHILSQNKKDKNVVISTWMEHAANDLPWRDKFITDYIEIDKSGRLILNDLEKKLIKYKGKVSLVTVTGASNVTGYVNPVYEIAELAHKYGAKIHVDAAQLISHKKIDMKPFESPQHLDFLSFSSHKMYAPFGCGVLIGSREAFTYGLPYAQGGSAIDLVTHNKIEWNEPPEKDEAGTPNLMGIVALISAIKTLNYIKMENISDYEMKLYLYTYSRLRNVPDLIMYNKYEDSDSLGIIPFNMKGINHDLLSDILANDSAIAVRSGFFCAHPYCQRLLGYSEKDMDYYFENKDADRPGIVRMSLGMYNTYGEIDILVNTLKAIAENKNFYIKKYESRHI